MWLKRFCGGKSWQTSNFNHTLQGLIHQITSVCFTWRCQWDAVTSLQWSNHPQRWTAEKNGPYNSSRLLHSKKFHMGKQILRMTKTKWIERARLQREVGVGIFYRFWCLDSSRRKGCCGVSRGRIFLVPHVIWLSDWGGEAETTIKVLTWIPEVGL